MLRQFVYPCGLLATISLGLTFVVFGQDNYNPHRPEKIVGLEVKSKYDWFNKRSEHLDRPLAVLSYDQITGLYELGLVTEDDWLMSHYFKRSEFEVVGTPIHYRKPEICPQTNLEKQP